MIYLHILSMYDLIKYAIKKYDNIINTLNTLVIMKLKYKNIDPFHIFIFSN